MEFGVNEPRRIVRVEITPELLAKTIITGTETKVRCTAGLQPDASFVGAAIDPRSMNILLFFTHADFAEVVEGNVVPVQWIWMENIGDTDFP